MQVQTKTSEATQNIWEFNPSYSTVEFSVTNFFVFKVNGRVTRFSGEIMLDDADPTRSSVTATLNPESIETGNARRDAHLRSKDFLDVNRYPEIRFQSSKITRGSDRDTLRVMGSLSIKSVTRDVVLEVNVVDRSRSPRGEEFSYYTANTELDRFDFGVRYGRGLIGRILRVTLSVQASRGS